MNSFRLIPLSLGLASLTALAAALPLQAQAADSAAYRQYQCAVLGDRSVCAEPAAPAPVRVEQRLEAGPYARYLMSQGWGESAALAEARGIGEYPVQQMVRVTTRELTPLEKHDRVLGDDVAPESTEQTLSAVVDTSAAPQVHSAAPGADQPM